LLAFSRRQPLDPGRVDVARLVQGMFDLLNRSLGEQIEIRTEFAPDLWNVEADANQLESAILNLAVNARDAMNGEGVLSIAARAVTVENAGEGDALDNGDYVSVSVRDSGQGMPADVLARAFEPFFTTKEVGKGTGLGLSMVFGFVRQTGGDVRITSEPGHGTTVELLLPRCRSTPEDEDASDASRHEGAPRRATILIVEDDADVRTFTVEGLGELGFDTLEAADGAEALSIIDEGKVAIDLLLTDVVMPGMTGRELTEAARARNPGLRVLYMSGYPSDVIARNGRLETGVVLLSKPFTMQALAARVHEMLDEQPTAASA
jgi:CheY-like chemotaxis protein